MSAHTLQIPGLAVVGGQKVGMDRGLNAFSSTPTYLAFGCPWGFELVDLPRP